jgi:hypothetical protein
MLKFLCEFSPILLNGITLVSFFTCEIQKNSQQTISAPIFAPKLGKWQSKDFQKDCI